MKTITFEQLCQTLKNLGIQNGDKLFLFSDLRPFGIPEKTQSRDQILQFYYDAFMHVLGNSGTLLAPAFFYEYGHIGTPFDVEKSPVSEPLGVFCQWFNKLPQRLRSCNPMVSIAAVGKDAHSLVGDDSLCAFGVQSPWHKLRLSGGKILMFGAPFVSMTYIHYIEQLVGVPHRYFKVFPYTVTKAGKPVPGTVINYVRFLEYDIQYDTTAFQQKLQKNGSLRSDNINGAELHLVEAEAAFQIGAAALDKNPYFFLRTPPKFVMGKIPCDGLQSR